ncbi:MAG: Asp-tRNA(Asn)/Glu-tRNA(Gln) amidotransferase subunit GatB [Clostridia bacterium]|nr:Asp-tRNA(Asn)/Glu-tRNA(Gln) amidotransferase subunit GatB [Clostridia bacterium]
MSYETVIGLEIHAELLTLTKVFCGCSADFGGEENTRVCPRCSGMPGSLPLFGRGAAELAIKAGLALNCKINNFSAFDRKNYFYPDLPKAYQITQFNYPICTDGFVDICTKKIRINRIHIEEDAGKLIHDDELGLSLADYNRCGIPLIEIVTEPDIRSAEEAKQFTAAVALALKYAGVCDAKMEQGSLRCDVNISVMPKGSKVFGTRTEIKNLNSLRSIGRAIEYEYSRQTELCERGERVIQQTLHWNDALGVTKALRSKEEAHDYRYFPEPDIPPLFITDEEIKAIKNTMPEMPKEKKERYLKMGLTPADADLLIFDKALADFYDEAVKCYNNPKSVASMIIVELLRRMNDLSLPAAELKITPSDFAELCKMADDGTVSRGAAKDILKQMLEVGGSPMEIAEKGGMLMSNDTSAVEAAADEILAANPKAVEEYKAGSAKVFGFLMGQMCRSLGRSANPAIVKKVLEEKLNS